MPRFGRGGKNHQAAIVKTILLIGPASGDTPNWFGHSGGAVQFDVAPLSMYELYLDDAVSFIGKQIIKMTVEDIQKLLEQFGIAKESGVRISNFNTTDDGTLIHIDSDDRWVVYYLERGEREMINKFDTEDAACRQLLSRIRAGYRWDKGTRSSDILKAIDNLLEIDQGFRNPDTSALEDEWG